MQALALPKLSSFPFSCGMPRSEVGIRASARKLVRYGLTEPATVEVPLNKVR